MSAPFHGQTAEVKLRAVTGVCSRPRWVTRRSQVRLGGGKFTSRCRWPRGHRGSGEQGKHHSQLLPLPSLLPAEFGMGIFLLQEPNGDTQVRSHRTSQRSATMFNSSCWICLTLIYAVAFYSHINVYHLQLHMVTSSAI